MNSLGLPYPNPDERMIISFAAYLFSCLTEVGKTVRAAKQIQSCWRQKKVGATNSPPPRATQPIKLSLFSTSPMVDSVPLSTEIIVQAPPNPKKSAVTAPASPLPPFDVSTPVKEPAVVSKPLTPVVEEIRIPLAASVIEVVWEPVTEYEVDVPQATEKTLEEYLLPLPADEPVENPAAMDRMVILVQSQVRRYLCMRHFKKRLHLARKIVSFCTMVCFLRSSFPKPIFTHLLQFQAFARSRYQKIQKVARTCQILWRAKTRARTQRATFLKVRNAAKIFQLHWRQHRAAKQDRAKRNGACQKFAFLVISSCNTLFGRRGPHDPDSVEISEGAKSVCLSRTLDNRTSPHPPQTHSLL